MPAGPLLVVLLVVVLLAGGVGCGDVDGESAHFPGTVVFNSEDGAYHFHYLSPPWFTTVLPASAVPEGESLRLFFVPPEDTTGIPSEADAPYTLRVKAMPASADQALAASAAALSPPPAPEMLRDVVVGQRGMVGREMSWQESTTVFHREAYLAAKDPAASFRMRFTSRHDIEKDPLVTQMIASFEPRVEDGASP